ncbi:hypothetical protein J6590_023867, partial [Homalodisca vitripennis]
MCVYVSSRVAVVSKGREIAGRASRVPMEMQGKVRDVARRLDDIDLDYTENPFVYDGLTTKRVQEMWGPLYEGNRKVRAHAGRSVAAQVVFRPHQQKIEKRKCFGKGKGRNSKRMFIQNQDRRSRRGQAASETVPREQRITSETVEVADGNRTGNKSIKVETQGGKSFLKQLVIPDKMLNCLYGKVLPDPKLRPEETGISNHVMEGLFKSADTNKVAAIVKREPVFSSDAFTTFTRVVRYQYPYLTLPSEIITNKALDFDGDNVSILIVHSGRCFIETLMRLPTDLESPDFFVTCEMTLITSSSAIPKRGVRVKEMSFL